MNAVRVTYFESRQIDFLSSPSEVRRIFRNENIAKPERKSGQMRGTDKVYVVSWEYVTKPAGVYP